jgi:hypothetical protein
MGCYIKNKIEFYLQVKLAMFSLIQSRRNNMSFIVRLPTSTEEENNHFGFTLVFNLISSGTYSCLLFYLSNILIPNVTGDIQSRSSKCVLPKPIIAFFHQFRRSVETTKAFVCCHSKTTYCNCNSDQDGTLCLLFT